jgi:hypothetical protein
VVVSGGRREKNGKKKRRTVFGVSLVFCMWTKIPPHGRAWGGGRGKNRRDFLCLSALPKILNISISYVIFELYMRGD